MEIQGPGVLPRTLMSCDGAPRQVYRVTGKKSPGFLSLSPNPNFYRQSSRCYQDRSEVSSQLSRGTSWALFPPQKRLGLGGAADVRDTLQGNTDAASPPNTWQRLSPSEDKVSTSLKDLAMEEGLGAILFSRVEAISKAFLFLYGKNKSRPKVTGPCSDSQGEVKNDRPRRGRCPDSV